MKTTLYLSSVVLFCLSFSKCQNHRVIANSDFDYFLGNCDFRCNYYQWTKLGGDTVAYLFLRKHSMCVREIEETMRLEIKNDTIHFYCNYNTIPNCDSRVGTAGTIAVFTLNKRKFPNYEKMVIAFN